MTVAAIYARYSSDSQRDESIDIQVRLCTELIGREGWSVGEVYADYAMTGRNDERPAFQRMRADMEAGLFDVLVVYNQDRLARNMALASNFKRDLFSMGLRLVSYREGEIRDDPEGFLMGSMQDMFAEYYSRNLSVLIRGGIEQNARMCKANGQRRYGYRINADGYYEIDDAEAAVVRRIFAMYLSGRGTTDIAEALNAEGIVTERGNAWRRQTISKMLKNDRYIGTYRYAGHVTEGGMPAIVEEGDFHMVQRMMASKEAAGNPAATYMLSGKLYCAECGAPMTGRSGTSKDGTRHDYYECTGRCGRPYARMADTDRLVTGTLKKVLSDESSIVHMTTALANYIEAMPDKLPELEACLEAKEKAKDGLLELVMGGIDPNTVKDKIEAVQGEIEALRADIAVTRAEQAKRPTIEFVEEFVRAMVSLDRDNPKESRAMIDAYLDRAYLDGTGEHVAVAFSFDGEGDWEGFAPGQLRSILNERTPENRSSTGVRVGQHWWSCVAPTRTLYQCGTRFMVLS